MISIEIILEQNMNFSNLANDLNFILLFGLIVLITLVLRIFLVSKINYKAINKPLSVLALYCISFCLCLCLFASKAGIFDVKTSGNPTVTVITFYDSIVKGNYTVAYSFLNNCDSLGLEMLESSESNCANPLVSNALKNSYSVSVSNNAIISGLYASQPVEFTYLDIAKLDNAIAMQIDPILNKKIETLSRAELYTDDGHYKKDLMDQVYAEATEKALKNVTDYYSTISYNVDLEYSHGTWLINANDQMMKGLLGGQQY